MSTNAAPRGRVLSRKPPAERAAEILEGACELAIEQGLAAITLRSVASRVGVTSALVAHYSDGTDGLVSEVFARIAGRELDEVRSAAAREPSPTRRIRSLCESMLDGTRDVTTLIWVEALAAGYRNERLAAAVRASLDGWQLLVSAAVEDGVRSGEFIVKSPDVAAWQILGIIDGLNEQALVHQQAPIARRDIVLEATEGLLGLPFRALRS